MDTMTAPFQAQEPTPFLPVRSGAVALWIASPLLAAAVVPHPTILNGNVGHVVQHTGIWGAIHLMMGVGVVLGWWGVTCVVVLHRPLLASRALPIFAMTTVGAFVIVAAMTLEAFAFPVLAEQAPETLALDGPLLGSWTLRLLGLLGGGFLGGITLLGVTLARAGVWRWPARALAVTAVAFTILEGVFFPILGPLSAVAMAATTSWIGVLLWRSEPAHGVRRGLGTPE